VKIAKANGGSRRGKAVATRAKVVHQVASNGVFAGIRTSADLTRCMSQLIEDVAFGHRPSTEANAICNAAGKLLKIVEMRHKYGKSGTKAPGTLQLA
jgi:hypothetical protein